MSQGPTGIGTQFPDFFRALAAPFRNEQVKQAPGKGGKSFSYVSARTVMNRLDEVAGPEGWFDEYIPGDHSVLCKLSIRMPDGSWLTKSDAGGYAGMADQGDDDKSGFSDAFKRAGFKWGVGRYLYRDGVANLVQSVSDQAEAIAAKYADVPQAPPSPGREPKDPVRAIVSGMDLKSYIDAEEAAQKRPIRDEVGKWMKLHPEFALPRKFSLWTPYQVEFHLPVLMAIVKKCDAVSDDSSSERTTISSERTTLPMVEKPAAPARPKPAAANPAAHDPTEIADNDPFCELKRAIVDATGNLLYAQFGKAATFKDVMQMIDFLAWEISHPKGDDIVIGDLSKFVEPEKIHGNMAGFLRALLARAEEERKQLIESKRQNFG